MIKSKYDILNSKISIPPTTGTIKREKFQTIFSDILENKITIATAGAGYGKSTVVAQSFEYIDCQKSWYRLELNDAVPIVFINYFIAAISKTFSNFGKRTLTALAENKNTINQNLLTILINEIESTIKKNFVIVLDDCHEISENREVIDILQFFIDHIPEKVHIVLISRIEPPLSFSKYRASLDVNEIQQSDLEFNKFETGALFGQLFGFVLSANCIENLQAQTEGWVSGLILFFHLSKGYDIEKVEENLSRIKSNQKIFKEYMGENVYGHQTDEIKDFLLKTSVLEEMNAEFCNKFLDIDNSGVILNKLEKKHLFTNSIEEDHNKFSYHLILQSFLQSQLQQEKGHAFICDIHFKAASLFESFGNDAIALTHYLHAEHFNEVFRLLKTVGNSFFNQGRRAVLDSFLRKIPETYYQTEPWLLTLKAKLATSEGQLVKAVQYSNKAYELFIDSGKMKEAETALMDLGRSYYLIGDFWKAEETYTKILHSGPLDEYLYLDVLCNLIFTSAFLGNFEEADKFYNNAVKILEELEFNRQYHDIERYLSVKIWVTLNYGFRWHFAGDFIKSNFYADLIFDDVNVLNTSSEKLLFYQLTSANYLILGNIEKAYTNARKGLREVRGNEFHRTQEAWLRLSHSTILMVAGNYDATINETAKGLDIFQSGGSKWGEASAMVLTAAVNFKKMDFETARKSIITGLNIVKKIKMSWIEGKLYSFLAVYMMLKKEFKQADNYLGLSENSLDFSLFERFLLFSIKARNFQEQQLDEKVIEMLILALEIAEEYSYGSWLFYESEIKTSYLVNIFSSGRFKKYLISLFSEYWKYYSKDIYLLKKSSDKKIKKAASEIILQMPKETIDALGVCCFGKFRVFVGDREIHISDWKSNKARDLFKYLVLSRDKGGVHKDALVELIWPEQDYEKTLKRLHVVLPALRKVLEPNVRRGESSYLIRENELYRIDFGNGGFVDVDLFNAEIELADNEKTIKKKLNHLLKAEAFYTGDFLEEDLYVDWCFEERETLKRKYLNVLDSIIEIYYSTKENDKFIEYSEKYIELDIYSEEKYQKLMKFYFESGNISMGIKTYEKCYNKIVDDLDCTLSEGTIDLYEKFIKTKKYFNTIYK